MTTKLPQRRIGELEAGPIGLGCMGMTWAYSTGDRDDARSADVIHRAIDVGITLIDTADMYGPFTNEELVGRALAERREHAVLATKGGLIGELIDGRPAVRHDARPEHLRRALD